MAKIDPGGGRRGPHRAGAVASSSRNAGYEVCTAVDGEEGLEVARQELPDLIITDFQMPYMTGLELCRALAADREHSRHPRPDAHRPRLRARRRRSRRSATSRTSSASRSARERSSSRSRSSSTGTEPAAPTNPTPCPEARDPRHAPSRPARPPPHAGPAPGDRGDRVHDVRSRRGADLGAGPRRRMADRPVLPLGSRAARHAHRRPDRRGDDDEPAAVEGVPGLWLVPLVVHARRRRVSYGVAVIVTEKLLAAEQLAAMCQSVELDLSITRNLLAALRRPPPATSIG